MDFEMDITYKEIKNLLYNSENIEEHINIENPWYKKRTRKEISENFEYYMHKEVDNKYLDVYFEVPKRYWDDFKNKQKNRHSKIINKEFYGHILEKEYTTGDYRECETSPYLKYIYYIVKRYKM
jgi:hypothetical protein